MVKSVSYTCNICGDMIDSGHGIALRVGGNTISRTNTWAESMAHICPNCVGIFESQPREEALREALKFSLHVIEKGIEVRMGDQWPAIREILPDAVSKAKAALSL